VTKRDREVLGHLAAARQIIYTMDGWLTPMFCGGTDGSHHSATLRKLTRKGLVERKVRAGHSRPSYLYRITRAGRAALKKAQKER
jgi:uncharacterized protein YjhX (UPF0386 family)